MTVFGTADHHELPHTFLMFRWICQNIWYSAIFHETNDSCYLVVGQVEAGYVVLNFVGTLDIANFEASLFRVGETNS